MVGFRRFPDGLDVECKGECILKGDSEALGLRSCPLRWGRLWGAKTLEGVEVQKGSVDHVGLEKSMRQVDI